ncbi:ParA family protein [Chitinilyticum piscinae]|uniref:ParA family protein n=1 Tax=Chitinilyticum piscinae TaxID=2866724 RepID=A0A8J7G1B6_9NEIS|nr:ParA family protein [Chitinilyticum piscinae]MBE9609578.1 ParA family protein [Chitinilyticum piscinae]
MSVIAVFNQKGGVGKTTIAVHLAAALARNGVETIVIDLDPQAHLTSVWRPQAKANESIYRFYQGSCQLLDLARPLDRHVHFIPSHIELSRVDAMVSRHRDNLWRLKLALEAEMLAGSDIPIIIDCSPMLGVLAFSALLAADMVLIPVAAEYLALNGAHLLDNTLAGLEKFQPRVPRRYLLNRYQPNAPTSQKILQQLNRHYPGEVLQTRIHENIDIIEAIGAGTDVFTSTPNGSGGTDFAFLLDELVEQGLMHATPSSREQTLLGL